MAGIIKFKPGSTTETVRVTKAMRLEAVGGPVHIGVSGAKFRAGNYEVDAEQVLLIDVEGRLDAHGLLALLRQLKANKGTNDALIDYSRLWMKKVEE